MDKVDKRSIELIKQEDDNFYEELVEFVRLCREGLGLVSAQLNKVDEKHNIKPSN